MNCDLLSSIVFLLSAVPTSPSHDHLNVTIYENGVVASSTPSGPVLSDAGFSKAPVCPRIFVAIRSVLVRAAIMWPSMLPAHQIVDSLQEALFKLGECQVVFCQSELALLVSAHTAQDIISCCRFINETIPWDTLVALDAQAEPMAQFISIAADPLDQLLNLEAAQMRDSATYEQPNDLVNEYDGPLFDDWCPRYPLIHPTSCDPSSNTAEPHYPFHDHTYCPPMSIHSLPSGVYSVEFSALDTLSRDISDTIGDLSFAPFPEYPETVTIDSYGDASNSVSPSSTRSSPFPETPIFENFHPEFPQIISPMSRVVRDEEQNTDEVTLIVCPTHTPSPVSVTALSPLSECESLPSSRCTSTAPSSQSSESDSTSSVSSEEIPQVPVKVAERKVRRTKTGGIKKKKTRSKEKHPCSYCGESFTRDHDADRHQRTCKYNPYCSQKEQCKVCTKALPVRADAKRRHWGTLECSDAARKLGFTRMDEESYELL